ncbi:MAG: glutamate--cysteine ligase [Agarilytica sp.]
MFAIESFPSSLFDKKNARLLGGILRGVEREALRTNYDGALSQKAHPRGLGSALTHPQITTDFSEALLEFITPPTHSVDDLFAHLEAIHKFSATQLDDEMLWATSMPCVLGNDASIPVAQYGSSNNALMKSIYRVGLGHRYGRSMQTVAGVHYNFSLPNAFWAYLLREQNRIDDLQAFKDEYYFRLIRNFRRHYWLLIYLFGASPAMCKSFVASKDHSLQEFGDDDHTLHLPYATSLRMGDLGYQSKAQERLYVCYNQKTSYMQSLCCAITRPYGPYEAIGLKNGVGEFNQLNTSVLQIENEFYSAIRPKRTAHPGETALTALQDRGVEYIEVRCLDVNPITPLGLTRAQLYFLDTFLLYCALKDSPTTDPDEATMILANQKAVVNKGRDPELHLEHAEFGKLKARDWAADLIKHMQPAAELLDAGEGSEVHQSALEDQAAKVADSSLTPSETILNTLRDKNQSFSQYALALSKQHHQALKYPELSDRITQRMNQMSEESLAQQASIESGSTEDFELFLQNYYKQYTHCQG